MRVASGANGITSAAGSWHAEEGTGSFTGWGGYNYGAGDAVPTAFHEYSTSVDIYLNVNGPWANDTRFDFTSAINNSGGTHQRDFIFNAGWYNDTDGSPGSGTSRFVISASNNTQPGSAFAKNPGRDPIAISTSGWYTFEHHFYNNGGVLAVDLRIYDASHSLVHSWTLSDPTDLIGSIGGNRYGWFDFDEFSVLAFDNTSRFEPEPQCTSTCYVDGAAGNDANGGASAGDAKQTIQAAVNQVNAGGTVVVAGGTYHEDVAVTKTVTLQGAGSASTTISGPIGGGGAAIQVGASGVVVEGFKITRDGNNTTDWNNAGLNSAGVAVQGLTASVEIRDSVLVGNRTGIDVNNSNGNWIHNNVIDNNRTGIILRNQTDNTLVKNNFITNNWTVGVLFLDASGGTNIPVQRAANSQFNQNNISGNWYGQVVDRQSGGSIPPVNPKDFEKNWWGTTNPVVTTANSTEPGYAVQIPVAFGGTATPPGGQPDIAGPGSANIDYKPYLCTGVDASPSFGFQPTSAGCPSTFNGFFQPVDNANVNAAKAGQTIPVKWQVLDVNGNFVSNPSSFVSLTSRKVNCSTFEDESIDAIEAYTNSSGLQYQNNGNWQFNWKTPTTYKGTCRTMTVTLSDGSTHEADFQFK